MANEAAANLSSAAAGGNNGKATGAATQRQVREKDKEIKRLKD